MLSQNYIENQAQSIHRWEKKNKHAFEKLHFSTRKTKTTFVV
jgi:hypothetical protein